MNPVLEVSIACFTVLGTVLSGMSLFIVADLRDRIKRLEDHYFTEA